MENIIEIDGKRYKVTLLEQELTALPKKWYTDGTAEANEWAKAVRTGTLSIPEFPFIGNGKYGSNGSQYAEAFEIKGHAYITPAQFSEWVYKPWKESLKPKAPKTIEEVLKAVRPEHFIGISGILNSGVFACTPNQLPTKAHAKSVLALCQLYNVAKCLNECFEANETPNRFWAVLRDRTVEDWDASLTVNTEVIRFTSRAAGQHAADHFWHLFADFYMLEDKK